MPRDLPTDLPRFRNFVRLFIRDRKPYNTLVDGEESTDEQIDLCILLAIGGFNTYPPMTTYTFQNFPSAWLLLYGTIIEVLTSAGILQSRNQLDYSDGGITVAVSNKTPLYQSWLGMFARQYEMMRKAVKMELNIEQGWGGVNSEYALVSYGGGTYYNFGSLNFIE